ncbi:hypothetical protein J7E55_21830 [Bacillus sp. ISL-53]|nr:hypothetical protein [Bacillus sp. ISL-53]
MDVNESIVSTWLNENGYFILNNIYYGQFHSDIDILAVNLNKRIILDCEIKIRTGSTKISNNDNKQNGFLHICNQLNSEIRKNKVISLIGTDKGFKQKKLLITTRSFFGSSLENRKKWFKQFRAHGIKVQFIEGIVYSLERKASRQKISSNEVMQILRLRNL